VGAHPDVVGLLTALAAGDVQTVDLDARDLLDDDPGVAPGRDALQFRELVIRAGDRLARIQERNLTRDGDRRRHVRELHRIVTSVFCPRLPMTLLRSTVENPWRVVASV